MQTTKLQDDKAALRTSQKLLRKERDLNARSAASDQICQHLVAQLAQEPRLRLGAFMAIRGEVDLNAVLPLLPEHQWYLPKFINKDEPLCFGAWEPHQLVPGAYGILEPREPFERVDALDMVLVPGLAFTRQGHRLGMGGGFYDRTLNGYGGKVIGVAYEEEVLETLPWGELDRRMDALVTPQGWLQCTAEI